jgi:hypothetical protein
MSIFAEGKTQTCCSHTKYRIFIKNTYAMTTSIDMGHLDTIHHQRAIKQLIFGQTEYGIEEGFVFNFETQVWHRHQKSKVETPEQSAWSVVVQVDLSTLIRVQG